MPRPTTRVLALLELLQTRGRMSGAELARRLAVDGRTVRRYIVMLEELGIPITADRGCDGAYMLVAGFKLPPMMFTDDEALALSVGLVAAKGLGLAEARTAVVSAQAKLERVMPDGLKRSVRAVAETVTLELSRPRSPDDNVAFVALCAAAQKQQRVRLRYRTPQGEETERDFDPYGLAYRGGRWYVIGACRLREGLRSFRIDRIQSARPLEASFTRPEGFDALEHLTLSIATLPRAFSFEALLQTDLQTARRELFSAAGVLTFTDEGVLLRGEVDDLTWCAQELARLPFPFEILRPDALRAALSAHASRLLSQARRKRPRPGRRPRVT